MIVGMTTQRAHNGQPVSPCISPRSMHQGSDTHTTRLTAAPASSSARPQTGHRWATTSTSASPRRAAAAAAAAAGCPLPRAPAPMTKAGRRCTRRLRRTRRRRPPRLPSAQDAVALLLLLLIVAVPWWDAYIYVCCRSREGDIVSYCIDVVVVGYWHYRTSLRYDF